MVTTNIYKHINIDETTRKGVNDGGEGAATMREVSRQSGREGTKGGPGIMPNRDGAAVTAHIPNNGAVQGKE
jgi:hypothetical protein